jgi:predicted nucleic acid-binding protein
VILVDTSVWIDFFAGIESQSLNKLSNAINNGEDLCICGVIMTEVLQGIRDDRHFEIVLNTFKNLITVPITENTYINAAKIYRTCRKKGLTIRSPIDCIIAATCIENSAFLLHNDRDFDTIARYFPLESI